MFSITCGFCGALEERHTSTSHKFMSPMDAEIAWSYQVIKHNAPAIVVAGRLSDALVTYRQETEGLSPKGIPHLRALAAQLDKLLSGVGGPEEEDMIVLENHAKQFKYAER